MDKCLTFVTFFSSNSRAKKSSFVFTLTDKDTSNVRYGICHNFYRGGVTENSPRGILTSICILTNHQFISGFRTVLATLKKIIDSADRCCQEKRRLADEHNNQGSIWDFFTNRKDLKDLPEIVQSYVKVVETWIIYLLDAPMPETGKSVLQLQLLPDPHSTICFVTG